MMPLKRPVLRSLFDGNRRFLASVPQIRDVTRRRIADVEREKGPPPVLLDTHGRHHSYLRISLTEKCNLRCLYCMPAEGVPLNPTGNLLTKDETFRLVELFAKNGVTKVRLTGGEPTIRADLVEIIRGITSVDGIQSVGITTNGIVLANKLEALIGAGLKTVNISLDTLIEPQFELMTRRRGYRHVWKSIDRAMELLPIVKINTVVMRGVNDLEPPDFVELTKDKNLFVRFIEFMPFGGNAFSTNKFVAYEETLRRIVEKFGKDKIQRLEDGPNDTTKTYKIDGYRGQFGFITSMSEHFCFTCNRLRITADGKLKVCLHGEAEVSLRDVMRSGGGDDQLETIISAAVKRKKPKHAGMSTLQKLPNRPMILIGG